MSGDQNLPVEGAECCILSLCCWKEKRTEALAMKIAQADLPGINKKEARTVAEFITAHYTLVPNGLLDPFIQHYAKMARAYPHEEYP